MIGEEPDTFSNYSSSDETQDDKYIEYENIRLKLLE